MRRLKSDVSHRIRPRGWTSFTTGWVGLFLGSGLAVIAGVAIGPPLAAWVRGSTAIPAASVTSGALAAASSSPASLETGRSGPKAAPPHAARAIDVGTPPASGGSPVFHIQVGAFREHQNAERLVERLQGEGLGGAVVVFEESGYRVVRVGAYPSKPDADRALAGLAARGFTGLVVRER